MSNSILYGAYIKNGKQRFVYERVDGKAALASVNHVTRAPQDSITLMEKNKVDHTEYVQLGTYLGPDTPRLASKLSKLNGKEKASSERKSLRSLSKSVRQRQY